MICSLKLFPFGLRDICLAQDSCEEVFADIASMRIRDPKAKLALDHELVLTSFVWALEAKLVEKSN